MNYPISQLSSTGSDLISLSQRIKSLAAEADGINSAISGCYGAGGVGGRAGSVASSISSQASLLNKYGTIPSRACQIYSNATAGVGVSGLQATAPGEAPMSTFEAVLKDKWSLKGAVVEGSLNGKTEILGIDTGGSLEGKVLSGKVSTKSSAKWKPEKGDASIEKSISAEGSVVEGKASGNIGIVSGEIKGSAVTGKATGKVGATLYKDGKLSPSVQVQAKAEGSLASGEAKATIGNENIDVHGKASGSVVHGEAEASGGLGKITWKDGETSTSAFGVQGKAKAEFCAAEGKVSGGISIFGIKIDAGLTGKAGAIGGEAEVHATTKGVGGKIGASALVGASVEINIDWSGFKLW